MKWLTAAEPVHAERSIGFSLPYFLMMGIRLHLLDSHMVALPASMRARVRCKAPILSLSLSNKVFMVSIASLKFSLSIRSSARLSLLSILSWAAIWSTALCASNHCLWYKAWVNANSCSTSCQDFSWGNLSLAWFRIMLAR
uniref:Uncharacterized protein n=1 Tax=Cacopsylla melanoneura TaxID=428564 RepID=A0A8D8TZP6_9HEMI